MTTPLRQIAEQAEEELLADMVNPPMAGPIAGAIERVAKAERVVFAKMVAMLMVTERDRGEPQVKLIERINAAIAHVERAE